MKRGKMFKFKNGDKFPTISLGTWRLFHSEIPASVEAALSNGYEGIDTAQGYTNEISIENTINGRKTFLTTKIDPRNYNEHVIDSIKLSLKRLNVKQIDLVLIHWPTDDYQLMMEVYGKILEAKKLGLIKHAGVANFNIELLELTKKTFGEYPEVNQFMFNLFDQRKDLVNFCKQNNILMTGYQTMAILFEHNSLSDKQLSYLNSIATEHKTTVANILLRHSLQNNISIIPKSKTPSRVIENIRVLDINLSEEEMKELNSWDKTITTEESIKINYEGIKKWQNRGTSWLYTSIDEEIKIEENAKKVKETK